MNSYIVLRDVIESDLPTFFEYQNDPDANYMAAFTSKDPTDISAFSRHWQRILEDQDIIIKSIVYRNNLVGHVASFEQFGEREISYWIDKKYWNQGIATTALATLLTLVEHRPLNARAAKDNVASHRVLAKCGFEITGEDKGFSNARGEDVEEFIFTLNE